MDEWLYNGMGTRAKKTIRLGTAPTIKEPALSLKDLVDQDQRLVTKEKVLAAFCNDLRSLLGEDDLYRMIQSIFAIEAALSSLDLDVEQDQMELSFEHFYRKLSPIALRAILENTSSSDSKNQKTFAHALKEALRIAIEEELFLWQDKLIN